MKAYSSASGGVIFVPEEDNIKRKPASYRDFVEEEASSQKPKAFGKKKKSASKDQAAA